MPIRRPDAPLGAISTWLFVCCGLIFAMVLLGGITRLTESGLSIVYWRPFTGWLPPTSDREWAAVFDAYRNSPEFRHLNFWMTLEDFRRIFWLEYLHRLLGRVIGVVYLLPFLWFWLRYRLPEGLTARLFLMFFLGGAQGVLGWYMVKSGLVDRPSVSQYRLAAHLGLAVAIYGFLLHTAAGLRPGVPEPSASRRRDIALTTALIFTAMIWGAFLAGIDGGTVFNTFPLMDGHVVPPGALAMSPVWVNPFENVAMVQFIHRMLGIATTAAVIALWLRHRTAVRSRKLPLMAGLVLLQLSLGIATVLTGASIYIAWAHQGGAMLLFSAAVWAWREAG
ncbi:MAG: COX15/CtaA family protein [Rhodospirillaceae bacterium]